MRLHPAQREFIKSAILACLPDADVYLFGSRVCDQKKGGDIDILVIGGRALSNREKREIKIAFYKVFGEQKIDAVNFLEKIGIVESAEDLLNIRGLRNQIAHDYVTEDLNSLYFGNNVSKTR